MSGVSFSEFKPFWAVFIPVCLCDLVHEDEMAGAYGTCEEQEKYVHSFGWETSRKEITWMTQT
jgi:hypothetical protein